MWSWAALCQMVTVIAVMAGSPFCGLAARRGAVAGVRIAGRRMDRVSSAGGDEGGQVLAAEPGRPCTGRGIRRYDQCLATVLCPIFMTSSLSSGLNSRLQAEFTALLRPGNIHQ